VRQVASALVASVGGDRVATIHGLEPAWFGASVWGRAFTVRGAPGDNLALHQAVAEAEPDEVIVIDVGDERRCAHLGDILTLAAQKRGIAGFVLNGAVRDRFALAQLGVPVFHLGTSPRQPRKAVPGRFRIPIELLGARIRPGDVIVADTDGIVVVPAELWENLLQEAVALEAREQETCARLAQGETTLEIFGLAASR